MSSGEVSICNSALVKVGADRIVSLEDGTREANVCKEQFYKIRDAFLRGHPWNFAKVRASLAALSTTPAWGYNFEFQIPTDCMRILEIEAGDDEWSKEGDKLLYDSDTINVAYVSNLVTFNLYDPCFAEALAGQLAADISYSMVQSVTLKQTLMADAKKLLQEARSFDGQEGSTQKVKANLWNGARSSRGGIIG